MKATLYKLKEGYVLCSDEEIKEGNLFMHPDFLIERASRDLDGRGLKKVLTQSPDLSLLSEEDANRIGWFDTQKIFKEESETKFGSQLFIDYATIGFQKALELTSDRRFTKRDMIAAYHDGSNSGAEYESSCGDYDDLEVINEAHRYVENQEREFIQSLSQPKSWEVEYKEENGVYKVLSVI